MKIKKMSENYSKREQCLVIFFFAKRGKGNKFTIASETHVELQIGENTIIVARRNARWEEWKMGRR